MAAVPSKPKPLIILVGNPLSLGIDKKIDAYVQTIRKGCGKEAYISTALADMREARIVNEEIDMILKRCFSEAWFIGDRLSVPVMRTFAFLQEARCRIRSGAPKNSNLHYFLHVQNGIPCGTV